jgi:hypothetical protein
VTEKTNISELAYCLPAALIRNQVTKATGVPSLLPGETVEQAIARRAESFARINKKLAEKRAIASQK